MGPGSWVSFFGFMFFVRNGEEEEEEEERGSLSLSCQAALVDYPAFRILMGGSCGLCIYCIDGLL